MSHKRKIKPHSLVIAGTAASVSHRTQDNRRQRTRMSVVEQGAGVADATATDHFWADDLATNMARHSEDFSYQLGDTSLESQPDEPADDGINVVVVQSAGRNTKTVRCKIGFRIGTSIYWRTYAARDEVPQKITLGALVVHVWIPDENVRFANARARQFGVVWIKRASGKACTVRGVLWPHTFSTPHIFWRCVKWNGSNFVRGRRWLQELGLRVQLGHPPGVICPYRQAAAHDFVLYDLTGVHEMNVDFCGCPKDAQPDSPPEERRTQLLRACWWPATITAPNTCATFRALRHFQIINCLGKLSAYDFLRGLEMCTNHDGLDKPPDRRRPFMHIVRQWREVKRHKRAKRGHDEGGIAATKQGELAIPCRACPQPGWNLPPNWENINPFYRFIYIVFLAADANFRLGNRCVSSEASDPILGDGMLTRKKSPTAPDFEPCFLRTQSAVRGLRTTGVGGVTCSRHNMWRANGIGDLQVGERQCNIDFVVLSALMTFAMAWLVFSYDIACQYAIKFWERMAKMPEAMHLKLPPADVWWMVPNFHLPDHLTKCRSPFSFHWMRGAGMTNGEGIEQNWAFSNGAAPSTRLMGPGSRQATLEDVFGFHNYDRLLAMHRILPKRLAVAIKDGNQHRVAFDAFSTGLEEARPEQIKEWRAWVERWESTQHTTPEDSPFDMPEEVTSLRQIQLEIAMEEFVCTSEGVEIEREHTPSTFIIMGLHIEESQRRLEVSVRALRNPSPSQKLDFTKRRIALLKRIHKFRELQTVYMPSVRAVLTNVQKQMYDGGGDELPEVSRLFMPSEIADPRSRERVCAMGLPTLEARLREAEATEALESVRAGLRTRTMTNRYKLRNYTGQGLMTKGQGILRQINICIHIAKLRYRYSRAALVALRGHGDWEERLRMLNDDDIRGLNERALTAEEKAQNKQWADIGGAIIEGGITRAAGVASGEGSHTLSWIWYQVGAGEGENDKRLEEALRVEWCKALARSSRYTEEVMLLREEMRRTIAYGQTAAMQWDALAVAELPGASAEVTEGRCAYAAEQAATERARCTDLERRWTGLLMRADAYLEGRNLVDLAAPVTVEVDIADELDAEEEEARLEGEEEEEGALPEGQ
ncbi:hypothetical protein DFH08DRAFT_953543 [Mycena albidolilacea]|uniref:CxC2-like cysteine cluster KDZ transposase-associated domain-containing protein n=1 Tax=Mycena albidolilacea TaxID=1033008 RepID=A0AAD7F0R4_9AGAR|nr:hypothetical protein DFH08DRAFT_953543 [Mycena albidolilacea]